MISAKNRNSDTRLGGEQPDPRVVLYILSPSYSGSTLLTFLLAAHPGVSTVGELKASALGNVDEYTCSCGARLADCPFWQALKERMLAQGEQLDFENFQTHFGSETRSFRRAVRAGVKCAPIRVLGDLALRVIPSYSTRLRRIHDRNRIMMRSICELQEGKVFLDGSKDPERVRQFAREYRERLRVIHLVRDGRGVTNSYMKHYGVYMGEAVRVWGLMDRECHRAVSSLPATRLYHLKYEDLCANPQGLMDELFEFCELDSCFESRTEHHILGNAMRLGADRPIRLDEKWRRELSDEDLEIFQRYAGRANQVHGYLH